MQAPKACVLPLDDTPVKSTPYSNLAFRFQFRLIGGQNLLLNQTSHFVVDRMGHILMGSIGPPSARHGNEIPFIPGYYFHTAYHESIVKGDIGKTFEFLLIAKDDANFRYLHNVASRQRFTYLSI